LFLHITAGEVGLHCCRWYFKKH